MKVIPVGFDKSVKLTKAQRVLWNLREEMKLSNILGDHDRYVKAHKAFMQEYVNNPKDALTLPPTKGFSAPLFSRTGWNMLKVMLAEIFRKRTYQEKELAAKIKDIMQNKSYYV